MPTPTAARHRYQLNKSDSNSVFLKKPPKKLDNNLNSSTRKKSKKRSSSFNDGSTVRVVPPSTKVNGLMPAVDTAFKTFISARFCSAIWAYISDCDETFNYWEPLHYIVNGHGLQTWEYSPQYALRSYMYLLVIGVPGWIYQKIFNPSPILIFYMIRCILGFGCAVVERYLYKAICQEFGIHIGRLWLIFQLFSVGMFISSTALLPSSFSMLFSGAALAAWWQLKYNLAIFFVAISSLLGWPFAALIGLPIAYDMIIRQRMYKSFIVWSIISAATIAIPMVVIDSSYFGKITFAPLNIILYNVFTSHGPNLYGTEPFSYYVINGFLNFNIIWICAILTPVMLVLDRYFVPAKSRSTLNFPHYLSLAPFYLWILVFSLQPHKEERFLFPIYPFISLCGAITVDIMQRLFFRIKTFLSKANTTITASHYLDETMIIAIIVMLISTLLGISRVFALYRNYHAPMDLLIELNKFKNSEQYSKDQIYNVCIGKDWYRYPGSFFLPSPNFRLRFLKSEFRGILPAYYSDDENATAIIHPYFNDMNREDERMYFDYKRCHFLIDFDCGKYTDLEPNYADQTKQWAVIESLPFLIQEKSHTIFRAFYIPFLTDRYTTFGSFNLLKRKKMKT